MLGLVLVQLLLQSKVGALENNRWTNAYIVYSETVWHPFYAQKVDICAILDPSIKSLIKKKNRRCITVLLTSEVTQLSFYCLR